MADETPAAEAAQPSPKQEQKLDFTRDLGDGIRIPSDFQLRTAWKAVTGIAIAIIAFLLVKLIMITGEVLGFLQPVLVPVAVAGILAYLIDPVVVWLRGRVVFGKPISRIWAIVIVFVAAAVGITMLTFSILRPAVRQMPSAEQIGAAYAQVHAWAEQQFAWLQEQTGTDKTDAANPEVFKSVASWAGSSLKGLLGVVSSFFGFLGYSVGFIMVPIYLFFFLKDTHAIRDNWGDYVPLRASPFKDEVISVLKEINGYLIAFFRGQVLVSMIDGALIGFALFFVPEMAQYAIIFAVVMSILGVIPFVGFIVTLIPAVGIAFAHHGSWEIPLVVASIFIIVQQFDGIFIQPRIVGESVGLHPLTVIFSVFFWSLIIGGVLGALLAVPLTASVKVLFRRYIWENKLNAGQPVPSQAGSA